MSLENVESVQWSLYLVQAADGSLYTGITTDVQRRFLEHENKDNKNKGAKALRGRGPLKLVCKITVGDRSEALKLEYRVKQLKRTDKDRIVKDCTSLEELRAWLQNK